MKLGKDGQGSGGYTGPKVKTPFEYDNKGGPKVTSPLDYDCKKPLATNGGHSFDMRREQGAERRAGQAQHQSVAGMKMNQGRPGPLVKGSTDNGDQ